MRKIAHDGASTVEDKSSGPEGPNCPPPPALERVMLALTLPDAPVLEIELPHAQELDGRFSPVLLGPVPQIAKPTIDVPSPRLELVTVRDARVYAKQSHPRDPYLSLEAAYMRRIEGRTTAQVGARLGLAREKDLQDAARTARRYVTQGDEIFRRLRCWPWAVLVDGERLEPDWWEDGERFVPPLLEWHREARRQVLRAVHRASVAESAFRRAGETLTSYTDDSVAGDTNGDGDETRPEDGKPGRSSSGHRSTPFRSAQDRRAVTADNPGEAIRARLSPRSE